MKGNIPTMEKKVKVLREIGRLLRKEGRIANLVSSPEVCTHEWASLSTKDFPENERARSGDRVGVVMTDVEVKRPARAKKTCCWVNISAAAFSEG